MKKITFSVIALLLFPFVMIGEENLFSLTSIASVDSSANGAVFKYSNPEYIKNIPMTLKQMIVKYDNNKKVYCFVNGKLVSEDSNIHDGSHNEYIYDEKGRITDYTPFFRYEYESDFERKVFYMNDLKSVESLVYDDSGIKATIINMGKNRKTGEIFESNHETIDYFYENHNLEKIVYITRYVMYEYNFEYGSCENDDVLKKITCINLKDNSISFTKEFFYTNKLLSEVVTEYPNRSDYNSRILFSDYDKYGNFRCCKVIYSPDDITTYIREFVYEE